MNEQTTRKDGTVEPVVVFNESNVGCWIDGATGMSDGMVKLSLLLISVVPLDFNNLSSFPSTELAECWDVLKSGDLAKLSDDHCEFDLATEHLESLTADGLVWMWEAGDLILTTEDQAQ